MSIPALTPRAAALMAAALALGGCAGGGGQVAPVARAPELSPIAATPESHAMMIPASASRAAPKADVGAEGPSLWAGGPSSLLGDQRASEQGDILTVVVEIDESAEIETDLARNREVRQQFGMADLFGIPEALEDVLPGNANLGAAVGIEGASSIDGGGSVSRNEQLELRVAAVVTDVLPNGTLAIQGTQEVRVNNELRALLVTGFVRPEDISRSNTITYDKIASARISYGGRGQVSAAQRPRYGQRALDRALPF